MSSTEDALTRVRAIIGAWPETRERLSHGAPTWWGGRKTFATRDPDWEMVEELLEEGYRLVAPKRAVAVLDAR